MKERLTNNLGLKLLAVFLAFFLWLIVSNVSNPLKPASVEVPVEIINDEILERNDLTYEVVGKKTVTISYKVHTLDAYKVSSSDFYAYADVSELYDVTGSIPIRIEIVSNKGLIDGITGTSPGTLRVKTEEIQRKPFELEVKTNGEPEDGYALGGVTLTPSTVYVTGAVSKVGKISSIGVEIDTEGINADSTGTAAPVFYDSNGNSIEMGDDVSLSATEITYQVSVLKVKNLGLDFQVQGEVADGYRFTGVMTDIKSISVEGMKSELASLNNLTVPGEYLNLDGATKDLVIKVDLAKLLPENVTVAGGEEAVATVTLKVEPLEIRGFKFDLDEVELTGASQDYKYEFSTGSVKVDIEGLSDDLDALKTEDMKPVIDVSQLEPGEHKGTLELTLGTGFTISHREDFLITVTGEGDSPDESSQETAAGNETSAANETSVSADGETAKTGNE